MRSQDQGSYENLALRTRIGSLHFDVLLDKGFEPRRLGGDADKHNHFAFEIHFFVEGTGTLRVGPDEEPIAIAPNSVHMIGPGVYHSIRQTTPITRYYLQFACSDAQDHDGFIPEAEIREMTQTLQQLRYFRFDPPDTMLHLVEQIRSELKQPAIGYYANVQSLFARMIVHIVRSFRPERRLYAMPSKEQHDKRTRIIDLFFGDCRRHLTIEQLAAELHVSTKQTNRILQKYYRSTFKQKLLETRIEVAKDLLRTSDLQVSSIAGQVGYAEAKNFRDMFAQKTGLTPAQYRKWSRGVDGGRPVEPGMLSAADDSHCSE